MIKNIVFLKFSEQIKSIFKLFNLKNSSDILLAVISIIACIYILAKAPAGVLALAIVTILKLIIYRNEIMDNQVN